MQAKLRQLLGAVLATAMVMTGVVVATPTYADTVAASSDVDVEDIHYWNDVLLEVFRLEGGGPGPLARSAAMMHTALFDLINSVQWSRQSGEPPGYTGYTGIHDVHESMLSLERRAAGYVARDVLVSVFPDHQGFIEQSFVDRYGEPHPLELAPVLAEPFVDAILDLRANDGSEDDTPYDFNSALGAWQLTGHLCDSVDGPTGPVTPNWGAVDPFTRHSIAQFRQDPPGGHTTYADLLASELYADHLNEVKELGRYDATEPNGPRSEEQEEIAWFWANDLDGTYKPPGQLLDHTRIVAEEASFDDALELSRLFALVSLSMADAAIAAWDQKYLTDIDLWRPQTAIRMAAIDGNPQTEADQDWLPLMADYPPSEERTNPCFPAWVSGHAAFAASWAGIMRHELGDEVSMTLDSDDPRAEQVERTFSSFTEAAEENARSRVYLGVHFQFDADDGLATGFDVADWINDRYLTIQHCDPTIC